MSLSASLALTEQLRVLSLFGDAGLMLTLLIPGEVFAITSVEDEPLPEAEPSLASTVAVTESPLSK